MVSSTNVKVSQKRCLGTSIGACISSSQSEQIICKVCSLLEWCFIIFQQIYDGTGVNVLMIWGRRSIEIGNFQTLMKSYSLVVRTENFHTLQDLLQ